MQLLGLFGPFPHHPVRKGSKLFIDFSSATLFQNIEIILLHFNWCGMCAADGESGTLCGGCYVLGFNMVDEDC